MKYGVLTAVEDMDREEMSKVVGGTNEFGAFAAYNGQNKFDGAFCPPCVTYGHNFGTEIQGQLGNGVSELAQSTSPTPAEVTVSDPRYPNPKA